MKDILLLTHAPDSSVGTTSEWCESRKVSFDIKDAPNLFRRGHTDLATYRAMIIFGGDMEAWEVHENPWLINEKKTIHGFIDQGKPVFGVCLGSQLLAEQFGGEVSPMHKWEFGWYPVSGRNEKHLVPLHCHSSNFTLPKGCQLEASNEFDQNQGFSRGEKFVGYQFHTEINSARLKQVIESLEIADKGKIQSKDELEQGFAEHGERLREWFFTRLDRWWESV